MLKKINNVTYHQLTNDRDSTKILIYKKFKTKKKLVTNPVILSNTLNIFKPF